jgi:hypothetical protein
MEIALKTSLLTVLIQKELIEWSKHQCSMQRPPKSVMPKIKDKERLLRVTGTETSQHVLSMKSRKPSMHQSFLFLRMSDIMKELSGMLMLLTQAGETDICQQPKYVR